ncbi:MAG: tRNA uridine-5-carboxymethylaminomethyl(34) synthesis GTPase MnmE [Bacteroidales bacterium]|nr:tRNA uridine-5-carboxymethylaminomethyl(34) synthesis GTPase MnmE [Bacteroidales bacterium]
MLITDETICAVSTAPGMGAIAIVRIAGPESLAKADEIFRSPVSSKKLSSQRGGTFHYGSIVDGDEIVDDVVVSVFRNPHSFTGEDMVEIACHGSVVIQQRIMQLLISKGVRTARPGEFTQRAFANGKMDLSQAEAVADLIASQSEAARRVAMRQMKGGLSDELRKLRDELLQFCTLLELELDFSEEDVEFADRAELIHLISRIDNLVTSLSDTFKKGNAIKNGVPVVIVGPTNAGKSTLLNALLNEERAIVSDIHGTTRDSIEDTMLVNGVMFRFIDTAGLRSTDDYVEKIGIERTYEKIRNATVVLAVVDASCGRDGISNILEGIVPHMNANDQRLLLIVNKSDVVDASSVAYTDEQLKEMGVWGSVAISAKNKTGIDRLEELLERAADVKVDSNDTIVTNMRHYEALVRSHEYLVKVNEGLTSGLSGELVAMDIHEVLDELASITGEVSSQDVLNNIFAHFCIGK